MFPLPLFGWHCVCVLQDFWDDTCGHKFTIANQDSEIVRLQVNIVCFQYLAADNHSSSVLYQDWMWIGPREMANQADPKRTPRPNPQLVVHLVFVLLREL